MPLANTASFVDLTNAVGLTNGRVKYNENDPAKPWYTGALSRAKRGDWVRFMVQFLLAGRPLPQNETITGVVESVIPGVLKVRIESFAAERTGLQQGELVDLFPHHVLEHISADAETLAKTELALSPTEDMKEFVPGTIGGHANHEGKKVSMDQFRANMQPVSPTGPGKYLTRNGAEAVIWTADGSAWFGNVAGRNTRWEANGTAPGRAEIDLVQEIAVVRRQREEVAS